MAVRLACPACGTLLTPKPADAGSILPCAGCGSDIQVPKTLPATAKPAPKPLDLDDEEELEEKRPPRAAKATGGSLLWLWVLLGTGLLGLVVGAGVVLLTREKPADKPAVVEKQQPAQPKPPGSEGEQPKVDPPKTGPPKGNAPTTDPPKKDPPKVAGPTVAQTLPGLKFYLPLNALADGQVTEALSGKPVGTVAAATVTEGPRGNKALRLTHDRKNPGRHALDLSDQKDAFVIPAGKPFTLTFWAKRFHSDVNSGFGVYVLDGSTALTNPQSRDVHLQLLPNTPATAAVTLLDAVRGDPGTLKSIRPNNTATDPEDWNHFTLLRDERGYVWWLVNGNEAPGARVAQFPGELRYDTLGLVRSLEGKTVIDLSDFCLYDRALSEGELATLTGLKIPPRSQPVVLPEGKLPAPGAVPVASDIKGLRFYLPCDAIEGGSLKEAISGKLVGKGRKLELVDGPRGKALRVTAGGPGGIREGFDLTASVDVLAVEEDKPFTLAMWVRTNDWDSINSKFLDAHENTPTRFRTLSLYRYTKGLGFYVQQGKPGGGADPMNQAARGTREMPATKGWIHLALTRDEKGVVRFSVDGEQAAVAPAPYTAAVRFTSLSLCWQQGGTLTVDFDEICLFDRVLTAEEIARLAGRGK